MERFNQAELERLVRRGEEPSVSIFQPTHRQGSEIQQDPIRLKNLLGLARQRLADRALSDADIERIVRPAEALLGEPTFWRHQRGGLAIFLRDGEMLSYRVPLPMPELAVVGERFHVKPLLPLLTGDGAFFVLAVDQQQVRLLEGTRHSISEVEVEGLPKNIEEALPFDDPEAQLQFRAGPSPRPAGPGPGASRPGVVFHGHDPKDDEKDALVRFCRIVATHVRDALADQTAPLVLAGVEDLLGIYRDVNRYQRVLSGAVEGNPKLLRDEELHDRAWAIVHPVFKQAEDDARAKFSRWSGTGRTAEGPPDVVRAAGEGRVEALFVARDAHAWGRVDPDTGSVDTSESPSPGDEDLLDRAAVDTLRNGGTVYTAAPERIPGNGTIAAVLRY